MNLWPYDSDLMPAGPLGEHELDAACWRKRQVALTRDQTDGADSMADWAQPMPAEAATELGAEPPRVVDTLRRQRAITAVLFVALGAVVCGVCVAGYLRVPA